MATEANTMTLANLSFRRAARGDLPAIVALLADDTLGAMRENATLPPASGYVAAFDEITRDDNQFLLVAEMDARVVGTLQITIIPGLSHQGSRRGQVEAVRIASDHRNNGLGRRFLAHAIGICRARGCRTLELTTSNARTGAQRFYESLGFEASHKGYKLKIDSDQP
jgi:ribosomal protein S18 acetylase RimI-like enzyme